MREHSAGNRSPQNFAEFSLKTLLSLYGPTFRTITPQGYVLQEWAGKLKKPEFAHYFCGPHDVPGAICPNCSKPLLRLLALDTCDPRLGLEYCPFPVLSLFSCLTCEISMHPFSYQLLAPDG